MAEHCARLACGCVIDAAHHVLGTTKGEASSSSPAMGSPPVAGSPSRRPRASFALVRPPGHHAGYDDTPNHRAEGFCFFNSVAVAAGCVLRSGAAERVCILDWDVHHGNGTQQLFYDDGRVLYISLHRFGDRWYPETGDVDEVGEGAGVGMNVNIPWPENGLGDSDYLAAFHLVVLPIILSHNPDLLLLSAGFDAADGDAQGKMHVTPTGFASLTTLLMRKLRCPIAAALEGGYNRVVTPQCTEAVIRVLLGERPDAPQTQLLKPCTETTLREVIKVHQAHWPVLGGQEEALARFFHEAAAKGQPPRVWRRTASSSHARRRRRCADGRAAGATRARCGANCRMTSTSARAATACDGTSRDEARGAGPQRRRPGPR